VSIAAITTNIGLGGGGLAGRGRVVTVRPIGPPGTVPPQEPTRAPGGAPTPPGRAAQPAIRGTAYQTSTDGDSVTLGSKLAELTEEERREVEGLKSRDREVRTHEEAHVAAAGPLFRGGPYYEFRTGPDGRKYAVAGRVSIDTSEGKTPEETVEKAARIRRAALAPAEPSSTDQRIAAKASQMEALAKAELARSDRGEADGAGPERAGSGRVEAGGERAAWDPDRMSLGRSASRGLDVLA